MRWQTIESAPKDGHVYWVKGNNRGDRQKGEHYTFAYWNGQYWIDPADNRSHLIHLTHWAQHEQVYRDEHDI